MLLEKPALEVGLEDLHYGDEPLHLVEPAAQLGFPSPGSLQTRLGFGQPVPEVVNGGGGGRARPGWG